MTGTLNLPVAAEDHAAPNGAANVNGIVRMPAERGEVPCTSWNLCGRLKTPTYQQPPKKVELLVPALATDPSKNHSF